MHGTILSLQARYKTAKNMEYSTKVLHKKLQWIHTHEQTLKVALDEGQMTGSILRFCDCHYHCIASKQISTKFKKSARIDNFRPKLQIKVANKGQSCRVANKRVYCPENLFATFAHPWSYYSITQCIERKKITCTLVIFLCYLILGQALLLSKGHSSTLPQPLLIPWF